MGMITYASEVAAFSTGFLKAQWNRESWRQARDGDDGNERRAPAGSDGKDRKRLFLPFPSLHSSPLSLIINSNIPQKVIASDWGRGRFFLSRLTRPTGV